MGKSEISFINLLLMLKIKIINVLIYFDAIFAHVLFQECSKYKQFNLFLK